MILERILLPGYGLKAMGLVPLKVCFCRLKFQKHYCDSSAQDLGNGSQPSTATPYLTLRPS